MRKTKNFIIAVIILFTTNVVLFAQESYIDILLYPEKYIEKDIFIKGKFYYNYTERKSFVIKQDDNEIEIFYQNLSKKDQSTILNESNFSGTIVSVRGIVHSYANTKNSFYIMATDIDGLKVQNNDANQDLQYVDILLEPEKYVGKEIIIVGKFYYNYSERRSFIIKQGDNEIEIFYKDLNKEIQGNILRQKNFSGVYIKAKGILSYYSNKNNSFYVNATDVIIK